MNEQEKIEERGMRSEEGLQALGKKTEYRMDYAPEVSLHPRPSDG